MARPAEKARAMLNKWVSMREAGNDDVIEQQRRIRNRRPYLASQCEYLSDAERYRNQIIHEISTCIEKIQNPGLDEYTIRELNDDINHKMREKYHWNKRIYELGGLDYNIIEKRRRIMESEHEQEQGDVSQMIYSDGGQYRYYGTAKDLPGVRELLEKEIEKQRKSRIGKSKKTTIDSYYYRNVTPDYYGWRDEEDGIILQLEHIATTKQMMKCYNNEEKKKKRKQNYYHYGIKANNKNECHNNEDEEEEEEEEEKQVAMKINNDEKEGDDEEGDNYDDDDDDEFPSEDAIAKVILEHKKKRMMEKYLL